MSARDYVNLVKVAAYGRAPEAGALPGCATPRERRSGGKSPGGWVLLTPYRPYRFTAVLDDLQSSRVVGLLVASHETAVAVQPPLLLRPQRGANGVDQESRRYQRPGPSQRWGATGRQVDEPSGLFREPCDLVPVQHKRHV